MITALGEADLRIGARLFLYPHHEATMTVPAIDTVSYPKARTYPLRHGYQARGTRPTSIVVHSTSNSRKNTPFAGEAKFLFESPDVSAHYLVGKDGAIVEFLEPAPYQAWHAGVALDPWQNARSIGIELHHSVGDPPYPKPQLDALAWLIRDLLVQFTIPLSKVETHGQIALPGPYQRKHDPADWPHADFITWRDLLMGPPVSRFYRVVHPCPISETPSPIGPVALGGRAELHMGEVVEVDEVKAGWCHISNGIGFCPVMCVEGM